eukprot:4165875-Amphidinium_carterae.1
MFNLTDTATFKKYGEDDEDYDTSQRSAKTTASASGSNITQYDKPKTKSKGIGKRNIVKPAGQDVTNLYNAKITKFNAANVHSRRRTLDDLPTTVNTRATGTPRIS